MSNEKKNIFVVGGGTGGHFFPALAISNELVARGYRVYLITDQRCARYSKQVISPKFRIIESDYIRSGFKKFISLWKILKGSIRTLFLMLRKKPVAIVGFGGYSSFPVLLCAHLLRVPIILHEQNSALGDVNELFADKAKVIATSFESTFAQYPNLKNKIVLTGNPVRQSIQEIHNIKKDFKANPFNLLVFGGSQGAKFFSTVIPNALKMVKQENPDLDIFIYQQATSEDVQKLKRAYKRLGIECEVAEFFDNMETLYLNSHLAITRSGASTIAELIWAGVPSILIPFPHAKNNHQYHNAKFVEEAHGGWLMEQKNVTPGLLAEKIVELAKKRRLLTITSNSLKQKAIHSESILADTVEKIIKSPKA